MASASTRQVLPKVSLLDVGCSIQVATSTKRGGTIRNVRTVHLELLNYKQTFTWPKFFQAFFLGLILSVWDSFSDFFFASSVESVCEKDDMDSICGGLPGSYVQGFTYVFIGLPGAIIAISGLHNRVPLYAQICHLNALDRRLFEAI